MSRVENDWENLLNSTDIASLFLNDELRIRWFTTKAANIFNLLPGDVDRPITDLATDLNYPEMASDMKKVLKTLVFMEKEVATHDGRWFAVRIMPYRTLDNKIDGIVITFTDVTEAKTLEVKLRETLRGQGNGNHEKGQKQ